MPFIPHTPKDIETMLAALNVVDTAQLFDEVPRSLSKADITKLPEGLSELQVTRLMQEREPAHRPGSCFIGAGAYEHFIPAAVWDIVGRGEYYTAYTPYQAEASQGSLQLIYEYQTMMSNLMAMEISNASLYDGSTALAEAMLMAVRIKRSKARRVIVPANMHPHYLKVLQTILPRHEIILETLPFCNELGTLDMEALQKINPEGLAAVVIAQPNFFGCLEDVHTLTNHIHQLGAQVIALVNPLAMALLTPPGEWGEQGADIVCGEGQPLGVPLSGGGPYFGFMCCRARDVRQLPGRIVGRTHDDNNTTGYTLTLQAREQHIRRAKATSNICTNQGLLVTAATIHMALLGASGLRDAALASHTNARELQTRLLNIEGVSQVFSAPFFHEFVIRFDRPVADIKDALREHDLQPGFALTDSFPALGESLLVCATETKTQQDLQRYQELLEKTLLS